MQKLEIVAEIQSPHRSDSGDTLRVLRGTFALVLETETSRRRRTTELNSIERDLLLDALGAAGDFKSTRTVLLTGGSIGLLPTNRGEPFMEGIEISLMLPTDTYADDSVFLTKREINDLVRALKARWDVPSLALQLRHPGDDQRQRPADRAWLRRP